MGYYWFYRISRLSALVLGLIGILYFMGAVTALSQQADDPPQHYRILTTFSEAERAQLISVGVMVETVGPDWVMVKATLAQVRQLQGLGYLVELLPASTSANLYLPLIAASGPKEAETPRIYRIRGVSDKFQRSEIARTGAAIETIEIDWVEIEAIPTEVEAIKALGYRLEPAPPAPVGRDFPAYDSAYHNHTELVAKLNQTRADHPNLVHLFSIGTSYQGRPLWVVKISDNPGVDEAEPEILFTLLQHAREHLSVEQGLYILKILTGEYNVTPQITSLVNAREIYIIFEANPDGSEYDVATGAYRHWRKNRQPNAGGTTGTDLNRNWGYRWGCCGGSGAAPASETYRGVAPFSAPETRAIRDFINSRVINGRQQITVHIDFHSYGQQILWPYGYTFTNIPTDMTVSDYSVFVAMSQAMAATNGYRAMQGSDLYITDGSLKDWMYGIHRIFSFVFELYPASSGQGGFYPPDEVIATQTARNRAAILYLMDLANCPYRAIGKEGQYCGAGPAGTPTPTPNPAITLRGYWKLNETGGGRLDTSTQGNHLLDNNTVGVQAGRLGQAADFERDRGEYLSRNDSTQVGLDPLGNGLTLAGWLKPETVGIEQIVAAKYEYGVNDRGYRLDLGPGNNISFLTSPNGALNSNYKLEITPPQALKAGVWYHLAAVFDAQQQAMRVYLNGNLIGSRSVPGKTIHNSAAPFTLGTNFSHGNPTQFFDGLLDEWRVYTGALSQGAIQALMNNTSLTSLEGPPALVE